MAVCAFERDAVVKMDGAEYRLLRQVAPGEWQLEALRTGLLLQIRLGELLGRLADRTLVFSSSPSERGPALPIDLSPKEHDIAVERLAYVTAARKVSKSVRDLEEVSQSVSKQLHSPRKRPSASTLRRWDKALRKANDDYRALADNHRSKGNRSRRYPDEVLAICDLSIKSKYLRRERNTVKVTLDDAILRVNEANRLRPSSMALPPPTRRLLDRLVQRISSYDKHAARYGPESARKAYRSVKGHIVTDAPLERVEIDHTQADVNVIDPRTGESIGRPYITAAIDDYTRCVVGIYIGFVPPSYQSVQECLRHCLRPKVHLCRDYPMIQSDWHAGGRPRELVVDGGLEFRGTSLEKACNAFGITIVATPRRSPWSKGKIERFLGTLNRALSEGVPGTAFRSIEEKGDYKSAEKACITLSTLKTNAMQWIADIYHQTVHSETQRTPSEMWVSSIQPEDIYYPDDFLQLDAVLGSAHQRTLSHQGVAFEGLFYNSPELENLRRSEGQKLLVDIRVDESDLGHIHVLWSKTSAVFRVPALDSRYATGLSLFAHRVNRREQRVRVDLSEGQAGRSQAQQEILQRIEEDRNRKKLSKRAQRYIEGTLQKQTSSGQDQLSMVAAPLSSRPNASPTTAAAHQTRDHLRNPSFSETTQEDDLPTFTAFNKETPNGR